METFTAKLRSTSGDNLTPRQTAQLLNVPEGTLAAWRSTNRVALPFFKLGGHVRYRRADLDNFIEGHLRNASASMSLSTKGS